MPESIRPESWIHSRKAKLGAVAAGLLLAGAGAYELMNRIGGGSSDPVAVETKKQHESDKNKDPLFRATTLTFEANDELGSGSLAKDRHGYKFVTVEHIAQPVYDLTPITGNRYIGVTFHFGTDQNGKKSVFIPGVGKFDIPKHGPKPKLYGDTKPDTPESVVDRFTTIGLPDSIKAEVIKAERDEKIRIPEVVPLKAKFGDLFWMPVEETGKRVPYIYITQSKLEDNGGAIFAPLAIFDRKMDYETVMQFLNKEISQRAGLPPRLLVQVPEVKPQYALQIAQEISEKIRFKDEADATNLANWLPCSGDSGSPMIDKDGNIVGVLSESATIENKTAGWTKHVNRNGDIERSCGLYAVVLTP